MSTPEVFVSLNSDLKLGLPSVASEEIAFQLHIEGGFERALSHPRSRSFGRLKLQMHDFRTESSHTRSLRFDCKRLVLNWDSTVSRVAKVRQCHSAVRGPGYDPMFNQCNRRVLTRKLELDHACLVNTFSRYD